MAVAAFETAELLLPEQNFALYEADKMPDGLAYNLAELPEFGFITRRARQRGEEIREERMQLLRDGEFDAVPMPIDMTGTARKVVQAEATYGPDSIETEQWRTALLGDAERQVAEATSKMTWGYFKPLVHTFDTTEQSFFAYGHSVRHIVENGISPMADYEDTERSVNDFIAEVLDEAFMQSPYTDDYVLLQISECPDWAIEAHDIDRISGGKKQAYGGNVPEIEKRMIRVTSFDSERQERYLEQVAIPGTEIDLNIVHEALYVLGVLQPGTVLNKTELQGTRIMVRKDVITGVLDFEKLLDALATERNGHRVFMGEVQAGDVLDYSEVPAESERRNAEFGGVVNQLAEKMLELERDGIDKWQTELHINAFLTNRLLDVVKQAPEKARTIFDNAVADTLIEAQVYRQAGYIEEALNLEMRAEQIAPPPSSCGAGSCGLEGVMANSKEDQNLRKKLGAESGDAIVKDKERACRCGKKSIVYAYNKNKVTKFCESCGAFESKVSKAA